HVDRRHLLVRVDGIALDDAGAVVSRVVARGPQHLAQQTLPAERTRRVETHHRPHRLVVDTRVDARALQGLVVLARRDRAPCGRLAVDVCEHTWDDASIDQLLHVATVLAAAVLRSGLERLAAVSAPPHAPASGVRAPGTH